MKQEWKSRILSSIYCCLLLMGMPLAGCGTEADQPKESIAPDDQTDQDAAASSELNTVPDIDYARQLQLIADHASMWLGDTELIAEPYFYAVTDFDQNGRLEIVQSSCQGTGLYTRTQIWEVNEELSQITPCQFSVPEGDSEPDIIADPDAVYFDTAANCYFYIFRDDIRNGAAEHYQCRIAFSLQNGIVTTTPLAHSQSIYSSASSVVTTYTDADGNAIDEDAYNAIADKTFADLILMKASIGWTDYTVSGQMSGLTHAEIKNILENSWKGFSLAEA